MATGQIYYGGAAGTGIDINGDNAGTGAAGRRCCGTINKKNI